MPARTAIPLSFSDRIELREQRRQPTVHPSDGRWRTTNSANESTPCRRIVRASSDRATVTATASRSFARTLGTIGPASIGLALRLLPTRRRWRRKRCRGARAQRWKRENYCVGREAEMQSADCDGLRRTTAEEWAIAPIDEFALCK